MKKCFLAMALALAMSTIASADGGIPIGGRSCPQGQTCFTETKSQPAVRNETGKQSGLTFYERFIFILKTFL